MKTYNSLSEILELVSPHQSLPETTIATKVHEDRSRFMNITLRVLTFLGGFLAVLFFAGFLALIHAHDTEGLLFFFAVLFIAGTLFFHHINANPLMDTALVSFYAAGFVMLAMGLDIVHTSDNGIAIIGATVACISFFVTRNNFINLCSVLIINAAVAFLIIDNRWHDVDNLEPGQNLSFIAMISAWLLFLMLLHYAISFYEAYLLTKFNKLGYLYEPLRTSLVLSIVYILTKFRFKFERELISENYLMISLLAITMVVLSQVRILIKWKTEQSIKKILIGLLPVILLIPAAYSPYAIVAFYVLMVSAYTRHYTGMVIGIVCFLYALGQYYYDLQFTLLWKSISMMIASFVFLLAYYFLHKNTQDA